MGEHTEAHSEPPRVTLEGTYTPPDYLEEPVTLERPGYTTTIKEGRIEVVFHDPEPLPDQDLPGRGHSRGVPGLSVAHDSHSSDLGK